MTATRGRRLLLGAALALTLPAMTRAQNYDFLLHPVDKPVATFDEEFNHTPGELLINTQAPTHSASATATPWMGSDTLVIREDGQFGTGGVVGRSGVQGDYTGNGIADQADLDLVLLNWGDPGDPPPAGWINHLPTGPIDQGELDGILLGWGGGDGGRLASLPWEVDPNADAFYSIQAEVWMPEKSSNPNVTNSVAIGYFDNSNLTQEAFEEGRAHLWLELYYTDDQTEGAHDAHYRVRAKDTGGTVELFDSADEGKTVDLSSGLATLELAWKTSDTLNWRMYGAAVVDALGQTEYIEAADNMISGPLAGLDNQGSFAVDGVGFQMAGSGGMVTSFHGVPEPGTVALLGIGAVALLGMLRKNRAAAARHDDRQLGTV